MSKIRAWWCGLKEWQRVLLTVLVMPVAAPLGAFSLPVLFCVAIYAAIRDEIDDFMGRPDDR